MRLIDADALIEKYTVVIRKAADEKLKTEIAVLLKDIEDAPTIEAEPVRHGKWIREVRYTIDSLHSYQQYRCSECGMTYITNTKRCPSCGARMDEE